MKKSLAFGLMSVGLLSLASCGSDKENTYVSTTFIPAYNLMTPITGSDEPFVGMTTYSFKVEYPASTIMMSTDAMAYPGGSLASFTTVPMILASKTAVVNNSAREIVYFGTENASETGSKVIALKGQLTQAVYPPYFDETKRVEIPGYPWLVPGQTFHYAFMQYQFNGYWNVRTFWPDLTYRGKTETTFPQDPGNPFISDNIAYRIVMQRKDNAITNKADVIFYNAKFAPQAPEITVVLKNLDLKFDNDGYTLSGTDIIPSVVEAGALQDNPKYKFNEFNATVKGELTDIEISYKVANVYTGTFKGACMPKK